MRIGLPDLVSNSYFPAIAAVQLGFLEQEGIDAEIELIFPVTDAAVALRERRIDFLAGAAHAPLYGFPGWDGAKLVAALSHNTYWFLVVRSDLGVGRGDLSALSGLRIGAAPGVGEALGRLFRLNGIDPDTAGITIAPVPGTSGAGVSFGVTAAEALRAGTIDASWANGMGAEVAVRTGAGTVVVDARRDGGPGAQQTFPALSTTEHLIDSEPETVAAVVRGLVAAQEALRRDPSLATQAGKDLFPEMENSLIADLIARDRTFYLPAISNDEVTALHAFASDIGLLDHRPSYAQAVATQFAPLWSRQE
ncbi:ABC transporter substrate-binding protein [Thermocrispum agreste]|uniref:ABC transporter substrate-binding protein n=1 Tax=Thermocrispum agreste TaxID=37925 RepID=UPI0003FE55B1|nr:ABC transporter substrate-binding protein [Thermocrispum agreste]